MAFWRAAAAAAGLTGLASVAPLPFAFADATAEATPDRLLFVQVVFRHGARTPLGKRYWPELVDAWDVCGAVYDPVPVEITTEAGQPRPVNEHDMQQVAKKYPGGCSKGELTRDGQEQARHFGRWLRRRYTDELGFLPPQHQRGAVLGRSTNYQRTIATLRGVLTGLYPDTTDPIPIFTTEELDEILFGNVAACERLGALIKQFASAARVEAALPSPELKAVQERVRAALNLKYNAEVNFLDLHDAMTTMRQHGKPIPQALQDPELLQAIEAQATKRFLNFVAPPSESGRRGGVLQLGMGRLMALMVQRMEEAAAGSKDLPKAWLYSGHDSTIMPLLAALGKEVDHWPPYLSNLVLELWDRGGEQRVRVLYNKQELPLVELCGQPECTLQQFREHVLMLTPEQHKAECLLHFSHDQPAGEHAQVTKVASGSSVLDE